ncbi:phenylacetate-CoA oxygenase subunit PaaJ [Saccharopolyspora aridisoli]|uniref:Phenylacetate-CoA oxygenase subunit PaaJ n=1 Tax=Saccharopolyspora aridisoli TaxID=2530385 RepID=A0A4R4UW00_9PSEU|nr:phenylacetate-CoA oxygenase subunit PaaJ [Saccharopolyspora aridisoli]
MRARVEALPDPELPVITLGELGVIRSAGTAGDGCVEVGFTPTFLGCPAIPAITAAIEQVLRDCGHPDGRVRHELTPAWTTEMITPAGREKLAAHGIAPPGGPTSLGLGLGTPCPHCGSQDTRPHSSFGPTRCQSMLRCAECREVFPCITAT